MATLSIRLFGRLSLQVEADSITTPHGSKLQELLCYLLLQRDRVHSRETLAGLFWGECDTARSKKYLRQALWQIQTTLNSNRKELRLLRVDPESAGINPMSSLWLDVAAFENASNSTKNVGGSKLDECEANRLMDAVQLYRGDLLEGWYQDWCLFERERLQNLYLSMLDKLICYCEAHQLYQSGVEYGERILRIDRAHERTHQRMLRLLYLSGDRGGALRQYRRCISALAEELGVNPGKQTIELYEQICGERLVDIDDSSRKTCELSPERVYTEGFSGSELLTRLRRLKAVLADAETEVQHDIDALERFLKHNPPKRRAV